MNFKRISLSILLVSFFAFLSGGTWTYLLSEDRGREVLKSLKKFALVYDIVKKNYVTEPDDHELVDGAISGMLQALDPHSVYLSKEDFQEMQSDTRGEFGGLGFEVAKKDGLLTVVAPIEDTPASRAGILAGDIIAKIDDQTTVNMSLIDAVKLMRGKPGTSVKVAIKREGVDELIPFSITRAIIQVQTVKWEAKDGFGVVKIRQFSEKAGPELKKALVELKSKNSLKGLIIDLRNNPGGLLNQAVEVCDTFVKEGLIVYTQGREKENVSKSYATAKGTEPNYPLVVLINGGSASASEIVAGCLQDHKRAHLLGTQSFGKGSVQNVIPLDDGSGIKITVALYYTPLGRQIQGAGIVPDEVVRGPNDPAAMLKERDLPNHIVGVDEGKAKQEAEKLKQQRAAAAAKTKKGAGSLASEVTEDIQLDAALNYLKKQTSRSGL